MSKRTVFVLAVLLTAGLARGEGADGLSADFRHPPASAKPHTWWHWMNGNVSREGITADLEAMREIGLGGAQIFDVNYGIPPGSVAFNSPEWRACVKHAAAEARRLGLELVLNTASGWSCAGAPWNTPTNGMKFLTSVETTVKGPCRFDAVLPEPPFVGTYGRRTAYGDVAVLAYPTPAPGSAAPLAKVFSQTFRCRDQSASHFGGIFDKLPVSGGLVEEGRLVDLTERLQGGGRLMWDVPAGDWTILRIGWDHNFRYNYPASAAGGGFECDKLSSAALDAHWAGLMDPLLREMGPLVGRRDGKGGVTGIVVDSYEAGAQNWTPGLEETFVRRNGYSLRPFLPVFAGRVVGSRERSERFLEDFRRTVSDEFVANFGQASRKKAQAYGLDLYVEPYGDELPANDYEYARCADIPMGEFWCAPGVEPKGKGGPGYGATEAHVWGKKIVGAEAFTTWPKDGRWLQDPWTIKRENDLAYIAGINRIIYHTYAHQPWMDERLKPGMTLGRFGIMFNRNVTWWTRGKAWIDYQTRCQYLLQQGTAVSDVLYFCGEDAPPASIRARVDVPGGSDYDILTRESLFASRIEDGRIVTPGGLRCRFLVLPDGLKAISPDVLRQIGTFAKKGVTLIGDPPVRAFGLRDYPVRDADVAALVKEIWSLPNVFRRPVAAALAKAGLQDDFAVRKGGIVHHIHRRADDGSEIYFLAQYTDAAVSPVCSFLVTGRQPEIWNPETGAMALAAEWKEEGGRTQVTVPLSPRGSVFVLFRPKPTDGVSVDPVRQVVSMRDVRGPWDVTFRPAGGTSVFRRSFAALTDWSESSDENVRFFSGTAVYQTDFSAEALREGDRLVLDLGGVRNLATVRVNGKEFQTLWKPPFAVDVTSAVRPGVNRLEIEVVNTWVNRLIGDAAKPEDCEWTSKGYWSGPHLDSWPAWMTNGAGRVSGRTTFATWRHWTKDDRPPPSGLLGPVRLTVASVGELRLAVRGEKSSFVIVTGEKPLPSVRYAAEELRSYVKRMTGVELPVKERSAEPRRVEIVLTADPASVSPFDVAHETFTLKADGKTLRISGGTRGVLYGVYELLERFGGCGWYAAEADGTDFTVVPERPVFAVPADLDETQRPAFARRWLDWGFVPSHPQFCAWSRLNAAWALQTPENRRLGGGYPAFAPGFDACHNFGQLVPESEHFKDHPEYYSLVKGKRLPTSRGGQLCLTNPDVRKIVLTKLLAAIKRDKKGGFSHRRIYGVSQDDFNGYCECTNCAAIDAREESHAGSLLAFVNALAEEVEKQHPDVILETLAYMYSRKPPKHLKARDNVMPCLCSIECDFRHPFGTSAYRENRAFAEDLRKWRSIAKHLYLWDYTADFSWPTMPYPNLDALAPNLQFFRDNGVTEVFEEGLMQSHWDHLGALRAWLLAKLLWNPDQPVRPLVDRFLANYYGKAAPFVRMYLDEMQALDWDVSKTPMTFDFDVPSKPNAVPDAFFDRAVVLWEQAEAAVVDGDFRVRDHVALDSFGLKYAKLVRYLKVRWGAPVKLEKPVLTSAERVRFEEMQALARRFLAWERERLGGKALLGSRLTNDRLRGELVAFAALDLGQSSAAAVVEDWLIDFRTWPETPKIRRVDDADAADGRALRIQDEPCARKAWVEARNLQITPGATCRVRLRAKVLPQAGADPVANVFSVGIEGKDGKDPVTLRSVTSADADGAYRWYEVGDWTINGPDDRLWVATGADREIFLDRLEFFEH